MTTRGVLLVRLCNWVGEVVLSLPALRRLEAAGFELHLYGKSWAPSLLAGTGWPVMVRTGGLRSAARQLRAWRRTLGPASGRPRALLFTKSLSSALETRLAGLRPNGYAYDGRSPLLEQAFRLPTPTHAMAGYWHLAGCLLERDEPTPESIDWTPSLAQARQARDVLERHGLRPGEYVMLCPWSGADDRDNRKVWPGFRELAAALYDARQPVLVCPGPGEEPATEALLPHAIRLSGIDMGVYGALMADARMVVANDTGPGHLAAATGTPLIAIYGPQSTTFWTPVGPRVRLYHDASAWPSVADVLAIMRAGA